MRLGLSKFVFLEKEIIFCLIVKTKQLCEDKSNDLCQEPFDKGLSIRHSGSIRRSDELKVSTSVGINPLSYLLSTFYYFDAYISPLEILQHLVFFPKCIFRSVPSIF